MSPISDSQIEELTAYLDGELDQTAIQKVEQRLGEDPAYRAEMQALQKTWDFLDNKPDIEPSESFTKTTMELVVGDALQQSRKTPNKFWSRTTRLLLMLAIPAILFAISYTTISQIKAQPNQLLVEKLTVIENYKRYGFVAMDIEFLVQLDRSGLFTKSQGFEQGLPGILDSTQDVQIAPDIKERVNYINSFDLERKSNLEKKRDEFFKLSNAQQEAYEDFDRQLMAHENRDQLVFIMNAYVEWLKTIDSSERTGVLDTKDRQTRIEAIGKIRNQQAQEAFGKTGIFELPTLADVDLVSSWYQGIYWGKEKAIRDQFEISAKRWARENKSQYTDEDIRRSKESEQLTDLVGFLMKNDREFLKNLVFEDIKFLFPMLSREAQDILDDCNEQESKRLVLNWVASANQIKSNLSLDVLDRFADDLGPKERNELDKMSTENYYKTLREKYRQELNLYQTFDEETWESILEFDDRRQK